MMCVWSEICHQRSANQVSNEWEAASVHYSHKTTVGSVKEFSSHHNQGGVKVVVLVRPSNKSMADSACEAWILGVTESIQPYIISHRIWCPLTLVT